jgi:hypothetical protein
MMKGNRPVQEPVRGQARGGADTAGSQTTRVGVAACFGQPSFVGRFPAQTNRRPGQWLIGGSLGRSCLPAARGAPIGSLSWAAPWPVGRCRRQHGRPGEEASPEKLAAPAAAGSAAGAALDVLYGPGKSVTERFGAVDGLLLQQKIFGAYSVGRTTLPWFTSAGQPSMQRHRLNARQQTAVKRRWVESIREKGIIGGVRGEPWAQWSAGRTLPAHMLSFGGLVESAYECFQRHGSEPNVLATKDAGLNCLMFDERMPDEVGQWLVQYHNLFHGGSGYGFDELLKTIEDPDQHAPLPSPAIPSPSSFPVAPPTPMRDCVAAPT